MDEELKDRVALGLAVLLYLIGSASGQPRVSKDFREVAEKYVKNMGYVKDPRLLEEVKRLYIDSARGGVR